ncbi:MAG TPA: hypothetical protein VE954_39025 [Oligoflexus sp.]|uniref:hypothetical protein n=1 Tax=Oligoflexus sp. TaxID=1971216 RepID=UPI002D5F8856|nr:hypothetical protein [Oligoflexus sp.]HYX39135.1 hypothetical protein [Oligoflexus sp.]
MVRDPVAAARNIVKQRFPDAVCAFASGDWQKREETPYSIVSIVVIMTRVQTAYRESLRVDQMPMEVFVYDPESWDYLGLKKDRAKGDASVAQIMAQGEPLLPGSAMASEMQQRAKAVLAAGPSPLQEDQIHEMRYRISVLMNELRAPRSHGEAMGSLGVLHETLADFYLRGRGLWSASGSDIPKALQAADAEFAKRWQRVFTSAFMGDRSAVMSLVDEVLEPHGGFLFDGHVRRAPDGWKQQPVAG